VIFCLVGPWVSFPLNDDWQFGLAARELAEKGELRILPYSAMTLVGQAALGSLVWMVAPGFVALRLLTLVFWMVCGPATWWLARELGRSRPSAFVAGLVVSTCPLVVNLGTTFMTDVPFLALWTLGAAAGVRALRSSSVPFAIVTTLAAAGATSIRQPGLFLVLAFLAVLATCRVPRRGVLLRGILVSSCLTFIPVTVVYYALTGGTQAFQKKIAVPSMEVLAYLPGSIWAVTGTLAFLLSPALLFGCGGMLRRLRFLAMSTAVVVVALAQARFGFLTGAAKTFPYLGNILFNAGLGPITLVDAREGRLAFAGVPAYLQIGVTLFVAILGTVLVDRLVRREDRPDRPLTLFVFAAALLYIAVLFLTTRNLNYLFDRYLLPLLPLVAAVVVPKSLSVRPSHVWSPAIAILLLPGVGIVGTRDYHRWNEARWDLCATAERSGGTPKTIDGGFEYSGWHNGIEACFGTFRRAENWRGWWVEDPVWVVGVRPREGYEVVTSRRVPLWLGLAAVDLILSRRDR
jgi:4-amino-4-deoxy-L-arabinose transferase-like glycosyltransferase